MNLSVSVTDCSVFEYNTFSKTQESTKEVIYFLSEYLPSFTRNSNKGLKLNIYCPICERRFYKNARFNDHLIRIHHPVIKPDLNEYS